MKYLQSKPTILGGLLTIRGTRIPVDTILYRLKDGYSIEKIHDLYPWVDRVTLKGAIEEALSEAITVLNSKHHAQKVL